MNNRNQSNKPNQYSVWKYLVLIFTLIVMGLSALPTWYGENAAIHINHSDAEPIDVVTLSNILTRAEIDVLSVKQADDQSIVVLESAEQQALAKEIFSKQLPNTKLALAMEPAAPEWLINMGFKPITQGLDLSGGVQFLLSVDMEPVYAAHRQVVIDELKQAFRSIKVVEREGNLVFNLPESKQTEVFTMLNEQFAQWQVIRGDKSITVTQPEKVKEDLKNLIVMQNVQIMRSRIEQLGITEASVQRQGSQRIRIELPGVQDPASAKDVIGATASLSFHALPQSPQVSALHLPYKESDVVAVVPTPVLGGEHIIDAHASIGETSMAEVNITLDSVGGRKISAFSRDNIGKPMATVYHKYSANSQGQSIKQSNIISIANIDTQLGNRFRITGTGDLQQAQALALLLRSGSLTAPVTIVEERTIGPSLGAENVKNGFAALALGLALTLSFIALWYRRLGWVANAALVFNLTMLLGLIALIPGAVLTLPGIAGLVLTVGMAVDTNVLIFERIKEQMGQGRTFAQSISHGFDSAFSSIWDANLTTMIVAIALYSIGNGPIQGFALTLGLGLLTSMFTGIFASRALINLIWGTDNRREVKV